MSRFLVPVLLALLQGTPFSILATGQANDSGHQSLAVIRGRVICLDASGRRTGAQLVCNDSNASFGLISTDGKLYRFLSTDTSTAMFTDSRVRQRELQITARLVPGDKLEIVTVQSVREGKLYDIYYFCELCNVRAYAPGPCPCCRSELEFRETPP